VRRRLHCRQDSRTHLTRLTKWTSITNSSHTYAIPLKTGVTASFDIPTDLLIGESWRPAQSAKREAGSGKREAGSGKRLDIVDPSNGRVLTSAADCGIGEGLAAVDAAEQAAKAWAATAPRVRAKILQTCFEKLMENVDWLANLISLENGKSLTDARGEVVCAAEFFRWYSEEAVRINGELGMAPAGTNRIILFSSVSPNE
jgi:succinate-semialdehyde dehydrogenase/glutarate-semialdehyde dehydrogenase